MSENQSKLQILLKQIGHGQDDLIDQLRGAVLNDVQVFPEQRKWLFELSSDVFFGHDFFSTFYFRCQSNFFQRKYSF